MCLGLLEFDYQLDYRACDRHRQMGILAAHIIQQDGISLS